MTDFGGYRAMMVDFGVDPRAVDTMSLSQLVDMMRGLSERRGKTAPPSDEEREERLSDFRSFVSDDPMVRIH